MFSFRTTSEVVTDARDLERLMGVDAEAGTNSSQKKNKKQPRRGAFLEITLDTRLQALSHFFEWNSAAVVTERDAASGMRPVAVVTKVDLLTWLMRLGKGNA